VTKSEVAKLVSLMAASWIRPPIGPETVHAYCFALEDLDHGLAQEAIRSLIQTSRFLPTIAEIRERAVKNRVDIPNPEEAWGIVRRAIGTLGSYRVPEFDCDEVQAAVDAIGWREICLGENEAASRARFCEAMKSATAKRLHLEATGKYLPADRQLPSNTTPRSGVGDPKVRVTTGYGTARPELERLLEADAAMVALAGNEEKIQEFLEKFSSTRMT